MKTKLTIALIAISFFAGCSAKRNAATSPQLGSVIRQVEDISDTASLAASDGKEVREALTLASEDSKLIKSLHGRSLQLHRESRSLIDRADYKATILLK